MKIKVYIAWSGETSKEVASILKSWLPLMNSHIEVFVSGTDVPLGADWRDNLLQTRAACDCAIFCCTQDNISSPWLCFEAGQMSAAEKHLYFMMFDTLPVQIKTPTPLRMFPFFTFEKEGLRSVAYDLNRLCGKWQIPPETFDPMFDGLYPTVKKMLAQVRDSRKERSQENQSAQNDEDLKRDFATVNSKLDIILSRLKPYPRQENSL